MPGRTLDRLLQLPAAERAELARSLWESLPEAERNRHLTPQQRSEIGRQLADHLDASAMPWHQVRRVMQGGD